MKFGNKTMGIAAAVLSAVCYGLNPLGALKLYATGMNTDSVLFGRFLFGSCMLFCFLVLEHKELKVALKDLLIIAPLGLLFGISALSLYSSFHYMPGGIASTLLFLYPMVVALMMALFFHESLSFMARFAMVMSFCGVAMLSFGDQFAWNWYGAGLVAVSIISYALYMVIVNKSPVRMSSIKLSAYVMVFCTLTIALFAQFSEERTLTLPQTLQQWFYILMLSLVPCVFSMVLLAVAIRRVGSTVTAVLGAFEPLTAVIIGVVVFNEPLTSMLIGGIVLILTAVTLITAGTTSKVHMTEVMTALGTKVKHWRWKHIA